MFLSQFANIFLNISNIRQKFTSLKCRTARKIGPCDRASCLVRVLLIALPTMHENVSFAEILLQNDCWVASLIIEMLS